MEDYVALIRHEFGKMFPVERLKKLCDIEKPYKPTGNVRVIHFSSIFINFMIIKFATYSGRGLPKKKEKCDTESTLYCDTYVKVFVYGSEVLTTV